MSSRKTKKSQKLGSSRRYKNRNRETEERENDDGFQDPENEQHQNEQSQFLTVSENQSSNESSLLHSDQPVIAATNPNTSVLELFSQPQSQDFTDLLGKTEVTSKQRKMGSTRKSKRNFMFEEMYEDEPEHQVQLCEGVGDEQGVSENASVKEYEGQKDHTSLLACAPIQSEHESSTLQGKHLALVTTVQNEDLHNNEENQHLEVALQSTLMDISSSELYISNKNSSVTQPDSNVKLQELNESLELYHQMDIFSKPVASLPNTTGQASQIDTTYTPLNGTREQRQGVQMSQNNLIYNDKPSIAEHTVLETIDTQSSLNFIIRDRQEDTKIQDSLSAEDIRQDEVTEVLPASLINEHEQGTEDNEVASVIWENVGTKASTENEKRFDHCIEHKDEELTVQLTEESIYKFESTEFREDYHKYKELCVAVDRTDNDVCEGVAATNLNSPIGSDTNISSPLKLEEETSLEQVLSYESKFQGDSEINCYRKEKKYLPEARCMTGESTADEEIFKKEVDMHYDEEKIYRATGTEKGVENNGMQSANFITESQVIPDETLYKETEANTETCNLQHNNSEEFPPELEAGDCSDQMLDKVIKDTSESSDIESEVIKKEKNDVKGSTESFTMEDFRDVDDEKVGMSTFMNELEMASVITYTQDYACTVQASMVVNEHCIESPTSASLVHAYPTSDIVEQIPETQGKLDMQVYCPIAIADQEQSMSDEYQVNSSNIESEAKQCESATSILHIQKSLGHDDSLAENVGFNLSEKNNIDSTLSGLNLGCNQKDSFKAIKEHIQAQSSEDGTFSFTSETCYPQSSESLNIIEPETVKMEENVIKAVVKNENMKTSQGQHETPQYISTGLVNTNQECSVLGRQDEEAVLVESIGAALDATHVVLSDIVAHLVDTEDLKMQSGTDVADIVVRNEEATSGGNKNGHPKSFKDLYQNTYPDLNLEQSKSLGFMEIVSGTINSDHPMTSAEPTDEAEVAYLEEANILQATSTPVHEAHMLISTNIHERKMGSIHRNLGGKEKEQDKEKDMSGQEKDMTFTERSTLLGLENEVSKEKDNNKREEINAGATENFTMEAPCKQQYMHSEMLSQNCSSSQTTIKHLSSATEHPDFKEDDSTENVKNSNIEIHTQAQTKKKRKLGSTRRPHGGHQLLAEREEGKYQEIKWKELENTEELEHQIIIQAATSNLLNEPLNTMSEVTLDIDGLPVTSEQKQARTGEIDTPPAILSVKADQIYPVVSYEVSDAEGLTDIIEQNEKPGVNKKQDSELKNLNKQVKPPDITNIQDHAVTEHVSLVVQMHTNEKPENECANKVDHSTCGPVELIPETKVMSDVQKNTDNFHTVVSDQNQKINEKHLENLTNRESEPEQLESASTCIQIEELKSSQVNLIKENVELSSSEKRWNTDLTRKRLKGQIPGSDQKNKFEVIKENENIQEQNMDQNDTKIGVIMEDSNDIKKKRNASLTENFTQKDITTACSQQHVDWDLSSQTTDHGLTTMEYLSPATDHPDFKKVDRNSKENMDNIYTDIHSQIQAKKKKKFGSTRRSHGRHQLSAEEEEGEWKDMENIEENEHQIRTQAAFLNLYTEPQITSEVTLDIHNSSVTTEQQQIITTEVETGTENIDSLPSILSVETDQTHTVVFDAVINAEGLTEIIEQNEKAEVNEEKNDNLNELKMAPAITKIQDDTLIEHVSLEVKMPSDKSSDNECVNECNIHSTYKNVENRSAEIHTQTQTKKMKKFGSTRRHGTSPAEVVEREWKDLENTEKIQSMDETRLDMPVVIEKYHTMSEAPLENPKNTESKPKQCEITCPVVQIQELKLAPGDLATQNLGNSTSGKRKKIGSTRRSLRVMKEKENIEEQSTEESTPNSEQDGAQKETFNLSSEISHQAIQKHFESLNMIKDEAEKIGSTCDNLEVKQDKEEAWQRTTDLNPRVAGSKEDIVNPESNFCATTTSRHENEPHIHHELDQSEDFLHTKIELYLKKSLESTLNSPILNPNISEFSDVSMSERSLQLPSSQNPQIHMEPSRRRKMGSSRKMSKNKNANVTDNEPTIDARTVIEVTDEVQALSQKNESSAQPTGQQLEYESDHKKTEVQVTVGELKSQEVSDPGYISEPDGTLTSHPVSEPRPGIQEVRKAVTANASTEDGLVSLDSIRKTMPSAVSTGERQKIDFEQWNEQISDFGQAVYNVVMVGNSNVGKTSFIKRLQSGHFIPDYSATIGVDTFVHTITFGSRTVKLYVWDTAGQERYNSITRQVFHKAQGLLLMYDITSSQSFNAVRAWISQVQEKAAPDVILMLLGNKNDCANREVQLQDGEELSNEYNIHFMECSAATGENLSESLKTLAWLLVKQRVRKEEEHTTLHPKPQNKKSGCC